MQNRSGAYSYSPPCIQNISGIFLFPSLHTEHIRHIFIPFPRMQTEPEHVFDCPHVCDGCTVRTDAIRHERTDVRKTRWTMKMYSGSASYRESSNLPLSPTYRESKQRIQLGNPPRQSPFTAPARSCRSHPRRL